MKTRLYRGRLALRSGAAAAALCATLLTAASLTATTEPPSPTPGIAAHLMAGPDEPGQALRIEARVLDAVGGQPVPGATVVVYQADAEGRYEPADPSDESSARLRAEMTTDDEGRVAFQTVLPGEYPDQPPGNRHIHVHSVRAAGYVPRGFVILFEDNVRDDVRTWAEETGFGLIIETTEEAEGLSGSLDIWLEPLVEDAAPQP